MSMKNNWPTTVEELVDECEWLKCRYDLYTLGKRDEPFLGEGKSMIDGTDYLAGDYQYGIAMVPAQWVTSVLGDMAGAGTCHMKLLENMHTSAYQDMYECDECGEQVLRETYMGESEPPNFCPNCGKRVVKED